MNLQTVRHTLGKWRVRHRKKEAFLLRPTDQPRFFILGTPHHGNLGDQAIAFAEIELIRTVHPTAEIYSVSEADYWRFRASLKAQLDPKDMVILHGGGNMGNIYPYAEELRQDAVRLFAKQKKLLFPQTVHFTNDRAGARAWKNAQAVYQSAEQITAFAREAFSFRQMTELFGADHTFLVPDIVLFLSEPLPKPQKRTGALLCLRKDGEKRLTDSGEALLTSGLLQRFSTLQTTDTVVPGLLAPHDAKERLKQKLLTFAKAELIVTDRLHGMLFAALTRTPCIALSNFNRKIYGVHGWLADLPYIAYLEHLTDFSTAMDQVLSASRDADQAFLHLHQKFEPLKEALRQTLP